MPTSIPDALNTLSAGLILISAFAMVATRQVQGVVRFFVIQSLLLAASSFLLGYGRSSVHLWALGAITIAAKVVAIPWVLRRLLPGDFYERREISQAINIPSSLLMVLLLTIVAEFLAGPLVTAVHDPVDSRQSADRARRRPDRRVLAGRAARGDSPVDRNPGDGEWRLLCRASRLRRNCRSSPNSLSPWMSF